MSWSLKNKDEFNIKKKGIVLEEMAGAQTLGGEWQSRQHAGGEGPVRGCSLGKLVSLFSCRHPCRDVGG